MGRSFGARIIQDIKTALEPDDNLQDSMPENEYVTGAENHPTEGTPKQGIPVYPKPLPGGHDYQGKKVTTHESVPIPPDKPYYAGGMAHGVKSPEHYHGRIAPQHHERRQQESEREHEPEIGHYKVDPIPVYITEPGAGVHPMAQASFRQVTVTLDADPIPIVERNPSRKRVLILNETAAPGGVRLRNGPNTDNGAFLPGGTSRYQAIETQDQIWAVTDSLATANQVLSVIEEYKTAR